MSNALLEDVKVGDKLFENATYQVYTVLRITPKGFIVAGFALSDGRVIEYRFNVDGHERTSDAWNRKYVRKLTDADIVKLNLRNKHITLNNWIRKNGVMELSAEQCDAIMAILEQVK